MAEHELQIIVMHQLLSVSSLIVISIRMFGLRSILFVLNLLKHDHQHSVYVKCELYFYIDHTMLTGNTNIRALGRLRKGYVEGHALVTKKCKWKILSRKL